MAYVLLWNEEDMVEDREKKNRNNLKIRTRKNLVRRGT